MVTIQKTALEVIEYVKRFVIFGHVLYQVRGI